MSRLFRRLRLTRTRLIVLIAAAACLGGLSHYMRMTQVMPQATIYFLSDVTLPEAGERVLIFAPHPDDETIGAGGYICEAESKKADVRVVLVTDGNKHGLEHVRYREFEKAAGILGLNGNSLVFLDYPDGKLRKLDRAKLYKVFKKQIESFDPDIVIYPHPLDHHPDHRVTGEIVLTALENGSRRRAAYQYLVHHSRFPQPKKLRPKMYLLPPIRMVTFDKEWRRLMLGSTLVERKGLAVRCYRTQLRVPLLRSLLLSSVRQNELFAVNRATDN